MRICSYVTTNLAHAWRLWRNPPERAACRTPGLSATGISVRHMRLLHTSDWHIGRSLHGHSLLADQEHVLVGLADLIRAESVDVVLIAGDVYDRAIPTAAATAVLDTILTSLRATGAQLVITPGNHDSAIRLGYAAGLLAANGVHLRTSIDRLAEPVIIEDQDGPVGIYGIPYLEPDLAKHVLQAAQARGHTDVLRAAMDRILADRNNRGVTRAVVLAHAFVAGGIKGDSERDITVGGVEVVPADVFAGVDYVALGHLHRPQQITADMRYSGSPLAYSFTEAGYVKSVTLADLDADGLADVRLYELPCPRRLTTLTGTLQQLLDDPVHDEQVEDYVSARLTDPARPVDAMRRLRERFEHCVHLDWVPRTAATPDPRAYAERLSGRSDLDIVENFVGHVRRVPATDGEIQLLSAALAAGRIDQAAS